LTRQIDLEREIACDDIVAESPEQARSYAACLTRAVALCGVIRPSLAAANVADGRSHLSRRVDLLVEKRGDVRVGLLRTRLAIIAIALIGAVGLLAQTPAIVAFGAPHDKTSVAAPQPALIAQVEKPAPPIAQTHFGEQVKLGDDQLKAHHFD